MDDLLKQAALLPGERLDDLRRNGLRLIQNPDSFCFGVDAVLLSAFASERLGKGCGRVLDLCAGNGVVPILMSAKTDAVRLDAIEIQPSAVALARRSAALNGLSERVFVIEGDVRRIGEYVKPSTYDAVTANPPYMPPNGGMMNESPEKAAARHETLLTLNDVASAAAFCIKPGGRFIMVHRPRRLCDVVCALRENSLEPKTLRFVHAGAGRKPNLMLIEAVRGGKPMLEVLAPLVIYDEDGRYTPETYNIYYQ